METQKRNRRKEYTLRVIRECFLKLLSKKPIEKISVGELCEKADINRSTFYRHYSDLYALLDVITYDCYKTLFQDLVDAAGFSGSFEDSGYAYILHVCTLSEQNKELYKLLLFGPTSTKLSQQLVNACLNLYLGAHANASYQPSPEARIHYQYMVYGMIGIWSAWIKDDCKMPKERIAFIVKEQILGFFNRMNQLFWPADYQDEK